MVIDSIRLYNCPRDRPIHREPIVKFLRRCFPVTEKTKYSYSYQRDTLSAVILRDEQDDLPLVVVTNLLKGEKRRVG